MRLGSGNIFGRSSALQNVDYLCGALLRIRHRAGKICKNDPFKDLVGPHIVKIQGNW